MTVLKFIGELVAIIGTILGLYFSFKREYEKKKKEEEKRFNALHKDIKDTQTEILEIKKDLAIISNQQNINEKDRIKQDILNFAEKLRVNKVNPIFSINIHTFQSIFDEYSKYKNKLNGNGYVDAEMEFIKEEFNEFQHK